MRIVHLADVYVASKNGIATSLRTLTSSLGTQGNEVLTVSVANRWEQTLSRERWELKAVPSGLADLRLAIPSYRREVDRLGEWGPDIVHVHTPGPVGLMGIAVARALQIPLVQTYHTDIYRYADAYKIPTAVLRAAFFYYATKLPGCGIFDAFCGNRWTVLDNANRAILGTADIVVVPTRAALLRGSLPVDHQKVRFIATPPSPINGSVAQLGRKLRARLHIPQGSLVVLFVGRLGPEKGLPLLFEAFSEILKLHGDAILLLVGPTFREREVRDLMDRIGIAKSVIRTGALEAETVWAAYGASNVFAFPSTSDTQAIVLDEAMSVGLPVVLVDSDLFRGHPLGRSMRLSCPSPRFFARAILDAASSPVVGTGQPLRPYVPNEFGRTMNVLYKHAIAGKKAPAMAARKV